jgi:hypothetical protein
MANVSKKLRAHYQRLYDQASKGLKRNPDKSLVEDEVRKALANLVREKLDIDAMAQQKAAHIIESLTKQEGEDGDDGEDDSHLQLNLFGEHYAYNPGRLVKDSAGNIIEEDKATLSFLLAELARSSENVARATKWNSRKARKAAFFQQWVQAEMAKGRKVLELTWGNCAKETGIITEGRG